MRFQRAQRDIALEKCMYACMYSVCFYFFILYFMMMMTMMMMTMMMMLARPEMMQCD